MKKSFIFKNLQVLGLLVLVLVLLCPESAMAAKSDIFSTIQAKMVSTVKDVRRIVYVVAGFGLVMFAVLAIFNKISWKHLGYIMISLTLLSLMTPFLNYFGADLKDDVNYGNFLAGGDASVTGSDVTDTKKCEGQNCPNADPSKTQCDGEGCKRADHETIEPLDSLKVEKVDAGKILEGETKTIKNKDGSETTVKKDLDGSVTTTTKNADGSETTVKKNPDGSETSTTKNADGSSSTVTKKADGSQIIATVDADGNQKVKTKSAKQVAREEARQARQEARQEAREQWKSDWKEASGAERMGMLINETRKGVDAVKKVGSAVELGKNAAFAAIKGSGEGKAMFEGLKGLDFSQGNFLENLGQAASITTKGLTDMGSSFGASVSYAGGAVGSVASGVSDVAPNTGLSDGLNTIATVTNDVTETISDGMSTAGNLVGSAGYTVIDGAYSTQSMMDSAKNTPQDMDDWMRLQGF